MSPWISEQNMTGGYQNQKSPFRSSVGSLAGGARSFRNFPWPFLSMEVVAGMWEEQQVPCEAIFLLSLQRLVESRMVYQVPSSFLVLKSALPDETAKETGSAVHGAALSWSVQPFLEAREYVCLTLPALSIQLC